ncbi:MAG: peroxiredoxin family protein [Desulfococcaceae bacterium]
MNRKLYQLLLILWIFAILTAAGSAPAFSGTLPEKGSKLPEFSMTAPKAEEERTYLGIGNDPVFTFDQIKADIIVLEIVGVYCPVCHKQFPKMTQFFSRIEKDRSMSEKVRIVSICAGNTEKEVAYLKKQFKLNYPVITDPKFDIHKALGEPQTPFTMLVTKDRKIVYAHLGMITDFDKFFSMIKEMVQ